MKGENMNFVEPLRSRELIQAVEEYLAQRSKRNQLIFVFGINTGLRISDILGLNVSDVRCKTHVEIKEKKTGKYKKFLLNTKIRGLLESYLESKEDNEPLFVGKKHKRLHRSQVYRFLNDACKYLGVQYRVGTHSMRKTFGYFYYKQYNDVVLLQKILNHSNPAVTLRYIGIAQDEIDSSYNNFEL